MNKNIITAYSSKTGIDEAINEIKKNFANIDPKMVIYFASSNYDQNQLSKKFAGSFDKAVTYGCSTSGELVSGHMLKNSIVAMAFDEKVIEDVQVEIVENVKEENNVRNVCRNFESHYHTKMNQMDIGKYVGIVLVDGMTSSEERIMDTLGDITNVTFIGGSAGDDLKFKQTYIYSKDKTYSNVALLALLKVRHGFDIIKTQSFKPLSSKLKATKVNEQKREVIEFNGEPADVAYAKAIDMPVNQIDQKFMHHPLGLMVSNEPYVRSPQQIQGSSMIFYCQILQGMELSVLESRDIIADTKNDLQKKMKELSHIEGILNFHCILRTLELESTKKTKEYGEIFKDVPMIGFSTYGEQYIGHVNQTSTMLVFK